MKRLLAAALCGLLALAGAARACTDPGGIGGTGIMGDGGIGGTGARAEGDVGLLGVITGFASICVNGIEVHYDARTPVTANGEPASAQSLALGQVVAVRATGSGTQARARAIEIVDAAVGPVGAVESSGTVLRVQGQRVKIEPSTIFGGGLDPGRLAAAAVGETLRVSGLRTADGLIVATRIEPAAPGARPAETALVAELGAGRFVVQGYVSDIQPQQLRVGGMAFSAPPELGAQLAPDRLVRVVGRTEGASRVVERADVLSGPFSIRPERTVRPETRAGREGEERRSGRSERPERTERSGRSERPERIERSGSNSGRR